MTTNSVENLVNNALGNPNFNRLGPTPLSYGLYLQPVKEEREEDSRLSEGGRRPLTGPGGLREFVDPYRVRKRVGNSQSRSGFWVFITGMLDS